MTVRVEFCGVPASGKSTLCAGALSLLRKRGNPFLDREAMVAAGLRARNFGMLGNFLGKWFPSWREEFLGLPRGMNDWHRFVVDHSAFAALVHGWLAEVSTDESWRSCVFYALLTSAFEFQLSREVNKPVLMDEGFAQRFFSLRGYRGHGRPGDAELYAAAMPLPTALVLVTTPPEVCAARAKKRAQIPVLLQAEPDAMLPVRFAEGNDLLAALAADLERRGIPVLRMEGNGDLESSSEKIADFTESICVRQRRNVNESF
jgi:hypothetical protein